MMRSLLCAAVALSAVALAFSPPLTLELFTGSESGNNGSWVCNDGSPSGYYIRQSATGSDKWVLHLQGGYWCYDFESCAKRATHDSHLTTSTKWPKSYHMQGLFSTNQSENNFHDWNVVYLPYCSSDGWAGQHTGVSTPDTFNGGAQPWNWHFQGKAIIAGVIQTVTKKYQKSGPPSSVLFSGCSAGAQGVINNLDYASGLLHKIMGVKQDNIHGLADAGWFQDSQPLHVFTVPFRRTIQVAIPLWEAQFDDSCQYANPGSLQWRCFFSEYAYQYIETPLFVHAAQNDKFQLPYNLGVGIPPVPSTTAALDWIAQFRAQFRKTLGSHTAVFSSGCWWHCSTNVREWSSIVVGSLINNGSSQQFGSLNSLVYKFITTGERLAMIDTCSGFNCNVKNTCPAVK